MVSRSGNRKHTYFCLAKPLNRSTSTICGPGRDTNLSREPRVVHPNTDTHPPSIIYPAITHKPTHVHTLTPPHTLMHQNTRTPPPPIVYINNTPFSTLCVTTTLLNYCNQPLAAYTNPFGDDHC